MDASHNANMANVSTGSFVVMGNIYQAGGDTWDYRKEWKKERSF
jgi:uncharacterized membrane protein